MTKSRKTRKLNYSDLEVLEYIDPAVIKTNKDIFHPLECSDNCIRCNRLHTNSHRPRTCPICKFKITVTSKTAKKERKQKMNGSMPIYPRENVLTIGIKSEVCTAEVAAVELEMNINGRRFLAHGSSKRAPEDRSNPELGLKL